MNTKRYIPFFLLPIIAFNLLAVGQNEKQDKVESDNTLIIYTYDSFASEWGPATKAIPPFEEKYGITVDIISCGDSGQVLSRAILEKNNPKADIILGIDNNLFTKAMHENILEPYKPQNIDKIPSQLIFDNTYHVIPFDYGYFAINYDSSKIKNPPQNLTDLTKEKYRDSIILMDPRTSSPGLGFLLWTISVFGDDFTDYWKSLKPSILTITDSWDSAYGLYTTGEAPMVLSYTTSPAYHIEYEGTERYKAAIFKTGNYIQIETMGILKGAKNKDNAKKFIEYMLTTDFQKELPLTNFMLPASKSTSLPASFKSMPKIKKMLLINPETIDENIETWIDKWLEVTVN